MQGNVGIGTTSPSGAKLVVNDGVSAAGSYSALQLERGGVMDIQLLNSFILLSLITV